MTYTKKQEKLMNLWRTNKLHRLNLLEGSVSSGKTWISLVLWAFWVANMPRDRLYLMCGKSLTTLKRNCLLLLEELVGSSNFTFSLSAKEGYLFGRRILLEGAADARSEGKIRGITLQGAYCDELTLFPQDFFIMLLSRLRVPKAKLIATTNPGNPSHWLKTEYIDRASQIDLLDMKFFLDDNTTLPKSYIEAVKNEYTGVFYARFILGEWAAAEGIIYKDFANSVSASGDQRFLLTGEMPPLLEVNIGVDFGGSGSKHAFVATGTLTGYAGAVVLMSRRVEPGTPQSLDSAFLDFCRSVYAAHGRIDHIYCDSAEQVLIRGMQSALRASPIAFAASRIGNAAKIEINDRIRLVSMLMGAGRFWYLPAAASVRDALACALWSGKDPTKDERLDDGSTDIDTLDALEYSIERSYKRFLKLRC